MQITRQNIQGLSSNNFYTLPPPLNVLRENIHLIPNYYLIPVFSCEFWAIFQNIFFTEHLRINTPADSSIPNKILFNHTFSFFPYFFLFIIENFNHGSLFSLTNKYGYKSEYFLFFLQQFIQKLT